MRMVWPDGKCACGSRATHRLSERAAGNRVDACGWCKQRDMGGWAGWTTKTVWGARP